MIPKVMHVIWFGDNVPSYCRFAIRKYRELNPDFVVKTYFKTVDQIERIHKSSVLNEDDVLLKHCIDAILNLDTDYTAQVLKSKNTFKMDFIQVLADIFRLEVLNRYGGIYVDCDTYPLQPFS